MAKKSERKVKDLVERGGKRRKKKKEATADASSSSSTVSLPTTPSFGSSSEEEGEYLPAHTQSRQSSTSTSVHRGSKCAELAIAKRCCAALHLATYSQHHVRTHEACAAFARASTRFSQGACSGAAVAGVAA